MTKTLITITGASCSGKSTLAEYITSNASSLKEAVSTTTRLPRSGEVHGVNYYFSSHEDFNAMKEANCFVENATFGKHQYGLSISAMENVFDQGKNPVSVVEPIGANRIIQRAPIFGLDVLSVFIDCPLEVILKRWHERYQKDLASGINNIDFYAERISLSLGEESTWGTAVPYNLVLPYASSLEQTKEQVRKIQEAAKFIPEVVNNQSFKSNISHEDTVDKIKALLNKTLSAEDFCRLAQRAAYNRESRLEVKY